MLLFFDIETAPACDWETLESRLKEIWIERYLKDNDEAPEDFYLERAWLYSAFSRILCISCWYIWEDWEIVVKTYQWEEKEIIESFFEATQKVRLCWWNIKKFDIPFIFNRAIVNGIRIPQYISSIGKKPWEVSHLDLMEIWKNNWFTNTWLALTCEVLWIPTPKDAMNWAEVGKHYLETWDVSKIVEYCEKDVKATIAVYQKMLECVII